MNEAERMARATRANAAIDEFIGPIIGDIRTTYAQRIVEIANTELNPTKRSEKLTALSNGIRIAEQIESAMRAIILDGEIAQREAIRADKMERMTAPQRRLFGIVPA